MSHGNARLNQRGRQLLVERVVDEGWAVAHAAKAQGISRQCAHRWINRFREHGKEAGPCPRILDTVGDYEFGNRFPRELSGGQQQRVGVARALVGDRDVLVADEPTGALDSGNSAALFDLLSGLSEQGQTVILSSHDASARDSASRVLGVDPVSWTSVKRLLRPPW